MVRRIVCPTDFSPGARDALTTAARLAVKASAELVIVHAWDVPSSMYEGSFVSPDTVLAEVRRDAQRLIDQERTEATRLGVSRVRVSLPRGTAWDQLVMTLAREQADLCILGRNGRSGLWRLLPGSVTERVARHAACPVLVVPTGGTTELLERVVCLVDFSDRSRAALELAARMVAPTGTLTLLHVIDLPTLLGNELVPGHTQRHLERRATEELDAWRALATTWTPARVTLDVRVGTPARQVTTMLQDSPTLELVAAGASGRTGIERVLLGAVAEATLRNARCAVLVVRDPPADRA